MMKKEEEKDTFDLISKQENENQNNKDMPVLIYQFDQQKSVCQTILSVSDYMGK